MKISVAMSTYNGARYLREQLDSIAAQTRLPDELMICDDGSTDGTREIISEFATTAPFPVNVHLNKQNLGSTKNFESAIEFCGGDLITLSDQDDTWLPEKLAQLEAEFARAANVGLIFTDAAVINDDGLPTGYTLWQRLPLQADERRLIQSRRAIDLLLAGSTVTGATMAFRGRFKDLILPIPTDLPIIHDAWIAILIAAVSGVLPLATPLIRYRQHSEQQVGARERKFDKGGVTKAMRRVTSFQELIDIGTAVQQRLTQHRDAYESAYASSRLTARLSHLQRRAQLPERVLPRFKLVVTELFAGRYHAYSRGLRSAAKDLRRRNAVVASSGRGSGFQH
jgi:glycosyltransferase involved in cell wall biosynthesis